MPDDDLQADMYLLANNILQNANFEKYEISNYSKQGYNSRHNLNYWNANTYYGFGCGACGYENNHRYENQSDLEKYIENPLLKTDKYKLTQQEKIEETIFLGFRKASGIDLISLKNLYDYDFEKRHKKTLEKYINTKHIIKTPKGYAFSNEGFLVSNEILCEFLA